VNISPKGANLIREFEGLRLQAYPDPGSGGAPWTIGIGHTGPEVKRGMRVTEAQAWAYFHKDIQKFERAVEKLLDGAPVTQNAFDAMVSLSYNIGPGNFAKSSVLRFHKARQYRKAADSFVKWNRAAGKVMAGLTRRRLAEKALYESRS
jgi:lysozyme